MAGHELLAALKSEHVHLVTTPVPDRMAPFFDWYQMPESYSQALISAALSDFGIKRRSTILDPFCGAGTTLVAAKLAGVDSVGIEINPFLCFTAKVKTRTRYDLNQLEKDVNGVLTSAWEKSGFLDESLALFREEAEQYASSAGFEVCAPRMPRLNRWICPRAAAKLLVLKQLIEKVGAKRNRDLMTLALASVMRPASNMKLTAHAFGSRTEKTDAPVFEMFSQKLRKMLDDLRWMASQRSRLGRATVICADSRDGSAYKSRLLPAELAITSPPYLNNLDYTMQTRLELFFLSYIGDMGELRSLRKKMMICDAKAMYKDVPDSEEVEHVASVQRVACALAVKLRDKNWGWDYPFMVRQYFGGLLKVLRSVRENLATPAHFILVLGESAHSGIYVPVLDIAAELAKLAGYGVEEIRVHRTRRSSSHRFKLREGSLILRTPKAR